MTDGGFDMRHRIAGLRRDSLKIETSPAESDRALLGLVTMHNLLDRLLLVEWNLPGTGQSQRHRRRG